MSKLGSTVIALFVALSIGLNATAAVPYLPIVSRPPKDLASRAVSQEDIARFAWQEFLALNWKASVDKRHPPSASNPRGLPDLTWSYRTPAPSNFQSPLVWQTYAQTTEFRPNSPLTIPWRNLGIPNYSYLNVPVSGNAQALNNLWNNLDEDNEIGSCDIYAHYTTQTDPKELVLFQVRVNKDQYEYLRLNFGKDQNIGPNLDSNGNPIPGTGGLLALTQAKVIANIKNPPYAYYGSKSVSTCKCPPGLAICLPCGVASPNNSGLATPEGTIEVKTAWRRLKPGDNAAHFFTTKAIYYDLNSNGEIAYYNDTFALIGMHIIHKTQNFPDFVFATFEQVDVERSDSQFILLSPPALGTLPTPTPTPGTELPPAVPIVRQSGQTNRQQMHPIPPTLVKVNNLVQQQLASLNTKTVWQYYRLTGVSGPSTDCQVNLQGNPATTQNCITYQDATACTTPNPNYYMANFMIESDPFLNNFSGPGFGNNGNAIFTNTCSNTVYQNKLYNNGGCKGCHGVAQTAFGTDFSFLLDFGNNKPSIRPATIHYDPPGSVAAKPTSLKHFLEAMKP